MSNIKSLEERTEKEINPLSKRLKIVISIGFFLASVGTCSSIVVYHLVKNSHEALLEKRHAYCQQILKDTPSPEAGQYIFEQTYPPNSRPNCLEIEQMYKEFKK